MFSHAYSRFVSFCFGLKCFSLCQLYSHCLIELYKQAEDSAFSFYIMRIHLCKQQKRQTDTASCTKISRNIWLSSCHFIKWHFLTAHIKSDRTFDLNLYLVTHHTSQKRYQATAIDLLVMPLIEIHTNDGTRSVFIFKNGILRKFLL